MVSNCGTFGLALKLWLKFMISYVYYGVAYLIYSIGRKVDGEKGWWWKVARSMVMRWWSKGRWWKVAWLMVKGCKVDEIHHRPCDLSPSTLWPFTIDLATFYHRPFAPLPHHHRHCAFSPSTLRPTEYMTYAAMALMVKGRKVDGEKAQGRWW